MRQICPKPIISSEWIEAGVHLSKLPYQVRLVCIPFSDIQVKSYFLLKLFLCPHRCDRFFSYTLSDDEISIILTDEDYKSIPEGLLPAYHQIWCPILAEPGQKVVSQTSMLNYLSGVLASNSYSVYYVGTAVSDYVLVSSLEVDNAIKCFETHE